jgi:hypothetical protein
MLSFFYMLLRPKCIFVCLLTWLGLSKSVSVSRGVVYRMRTCDRVEPLWCSCILQQCSLPADADMKLVPVSEEPQPTLREAYAHSDRHLEQVQKRDERKRERVNVQRLMCMDPTSHAAPFGDFVGCANKSNARPRRWGAHMCCRTRWR